jgi:hypothetical protein
MFRDQHVWSSALEPPEMLKQGDLIGAVSQHFAKFVISSYDFPVIPAGCKGDCIPFQNYRPESS